METSPKIFEAFMKKSHKNEKNLLET